MSLEQPHRATGRKVGLQLRQRLFHHFRPACGCPDDDDIVLAVAAPLRRLLSVIHRLKLRVS